MTTVTLPANYRKILLDFRADMFERLTLVISLFSVLAAYAMLFLQPIPHHLVLLLFGFAGFSFSIRRLAWRFPNSARYGFILLLTITLLTSMILIPNIWLPFVAFPLLLISGLMVSNTNIVLAAGIYAFVVALNLGGHAPYPLIPLGFLLALMAMTTRTVIQTFDTALLWYSSMHNRADELLQESRDRRAELLQTLKSLEISYDTQHRLQNQLVFARQQAEEARRLKERFAANISHELRTPLNIILGFSEIMYLTPEVYGDVIFPPKLHRDIYQIHRNSRHLLELIDDVLDLSHIDLSQFSLNFEPTDLNSFLDDTILMVSNLFRGKPVEFMVHIEANLPTIDIDRTRIRQVIINLLTNAQRFTSMGSVTFSVERSGDMIQFEISDTGHGIEPEKLALIFEEFYQVDYSLSRSHGGAGLGLPITKRFVEAHNGHLQAESQIGQGSVFRFRLPLPQPTTNRDTAAGILSRKEIAESVWLVADADPRVAKLISREAQSHQIVAISNEAEIEAAIRRYRPQGVIVNKPPYQPIPSALADLTVPTLICSLPSTMWMVRQLGVDACLAKPVQPKQLIDQLDQYPNLKRILVVDDDLGVVQLVQRSLEMYRADLEVNRAYDGEQALELMQQTPPDVLLLDLAMHKMSGFEVIEAMRSDERLALIPIILITATQYLYGEDHFQAELIIHQSDGLRPMEVLRLLGAVMDTIGK